MPRRPSTTADDVPAGIVWLAAAIALSPLIVGVLVWAFRDWTPVQDLAVIDLRVRDVFSGDTPLVGPYSRYGWNHPGPFQYWPVALFGLPFGRPAWATLVGHILLQALPLVLVIRWAKQRSGQLALVVCLFIGVTYGVAGSWMVIEAWNPHVAYAYWIAMLVTLGLVVIGESRLVGAVLVLATILVQLHVGLLPLVAIPVVLTLWWGWRDVDAGEARSTWVRRTAWAAFFAALLWVPPLVDEIVHRPGNVERLGSFFRNADTPTLGLRQGIAIISEGFALPPEWAGRASTVSEFSAGIQPRSMWWIVGAVIVLVLGFACARSQGPPARRVMALDFVLVSTGILAVSRITDVPAAYLFYWRTPLAAFVCFTTAIVIWGRLRDHLPARVGTMLRVAAVPVLFVVLLVRVMPLTWAVGSDRDGVSRFADIEQVTQSFLDRIEAEGVPADPILLRFAGSPLLGLQGGLFDGLDRMGAEVRTGPGGGFQFGYDRASLDGVQEAWYAIEGGPAVAQALAAPGARVIAEHSPLSRGDELRLRELQLEMIPKIAAAGRADEIEKLGSSLAPFVFGDVPGIDPAHLEELGRLNEMTEGKACRCVLVAFPIDLDPDLGSDEMLFGRN